MPPSTSKRRRWGVSLVAIYCIVSFPTIVLLSVNSQTVHHSAVKSCQQQNIARKAANSGAGSLKKALDFIAKAARKRIKGVDANQPIKRAADVKGAVFYQGIADGQKVVPLVDCKSLNPPPWPLG